MRPVSVEFVLKGNLNQEIDKIRLNVKGFGQEGSKSYLSILNASNQAFAGLTSGARRQAVALQKVITQLKKSEEVHESLKNEFNLGKISANQFAEASARLAVQQATLKGQAADLNSSLQRELTINKQVKGSYNERVETLKSLKETYAQLSEEEINNNAIGGKMLNRIKELQAQNEKFEQSLKAVASTQATSINGMNSRLTTLKQKYDSLSAAERRNANVGGKLARQMKKLKRDISKAETANKGFIESLKSAPGAIGSTVSGMEQMTKAALRFIATPLGAIIALIVVAMKALTVWFHRGSAGESAFAKVTGYFSQILNTLLNIASEVGAWLYKAFTSPKQALKDLVNFIESQFINRFKAIGVMAQGLHELFTGKWKQGLKTYANGWLQLGTGVQDVIGKTADFIKKTDEAATAMGNINQALYLQKRKNIDVDLAAFKISNKIAKLRITAMDYYGGAEKVAAAKKAVQEIIKLTKEKADMEIQAAQNTFDLTKKQFLLENKAKGKEALNTEQYQILEKLEKKILGYKFAKWNLMRRMQGTLNTIIAREHALKNITQQTTEDLKKVKSAYQQYYQYLRLEGKAAANSMFSDLIKEGGSYLQYLNNKIAELKAKKDRSKAESFELITYTVERRRVTSCESPVAKLKREIAEKKKLYADDILAFQEYLKKKKEALKDDTSEMGLKQKIVVEVSLDTSETDYKKKLNDLLQKYGNYTTKMSSITKAYQADKAILEKANTKQAKEALEVLTNAYSIAVNNLHNANDSYLREVFSDITRMSSQSLNRLLAETGKAIDTAKSKTTNGQTFMIVDVQSLDAQGKVIHKTIEMTIAEFQKLQKRYDQLYRTSVDRNPFKALGKSVDGFFKALKTGDQANMANASKQMMDAASQAQAVIENVGDSLKEILGKGSEDTINFIEGMTSGIVSLGSGIAEIASGDIVAGIQSVMKGIATIFTTLTKGNKELREAQKKYYNEAIERQLKYNAAVNEQIRTQKTGNIFIVDYVGKIKQAYLAMSDAQKKYNTLLDGKPLFSFLNQFTIKTGVFAKKIFGITVGHKDMMSSLVWAYPKLVDSAGKLNVELAKSLLAQKGLSEETKHALEGVLQYQDEIKAATDAINSAIQGIVGNISGDLYNALSKAFDAGTSSFEAFRDSVSKGIKQMVSQLIFNAIFASSFGKLADDLKASFKPGTGDQNAMDDMQRFFAKAPGLTKQWDTAMENLKKTMKDAGFTWQGLTSDMTGTSASGIADSIAQGFASGYRSASDFAKSFKDMMKAAVIESLKVKVLEKPLEEWFQKFSDTMSGGATQDKLDELKKEYDAIIAKGADYMSAMSQATGLNFGANQQADATGITTITEQTASKLEGNFIAVRVNTAKMAESAEVIVGQMAKSQLHLLAIEKNTNQLHRLAQIENILNSLQNDGIKIK